MLRSSHMLQDTIFMQPQIIDANEYVIREPNATRFNDEIRTLDVRIRQNADRFLGCHAAHDSGVLTRRLLEHLWRHVDPRHHALLVNVFCARW